MKKIAIVLFVVATALSACGKKKDPATPATTTEDTAPAEPAGDTAPPAEGEAGGEGGM
jgi:hypothetical protein